MVVGGSAGIGLETARQVGAAGGELVLVARDAGRLQRAADELNPLSTAAFDARDVERLERFITELPGERAGGDGTAPVSVRTHGPQAAGHCQCRVAASDS